MVSITPPYISIKVYRLVSYPDSFIFHSEYMFYFNLVCLNDIEKEIGNVSINSHPIPLSI
jgi:hypothetical protein